MRSFTRRPSTFVATWTRCIVLTLLFMLGASCTEGVTTEPGVDATITVSPSEATIQGIGSVIALDATATVNGAAVSAENIVWISLRPAVASVSPSGLVTTTGPGTALITATYRTAVDTAIIHAHAVTPEPGSPTITLSPSMATLEGLGKTVTLQFVAYTATGEIVASPTLAWTSLDPGIATVSSTGTVTSVAQGTARIRVAYSTAADTATIQVIASTVPPPSASLTLTPQSATLQGIGNSIALLATARGEGGITIPAENLTWATLDPTVASVSTGGLVTALAVGTARITVGYLTLADTSTITVTASTTPPPPPTGEQFDRTLADVSIQGDVVVPDGETWLIGRGVQIAGNLRTVGGTIAMRPGSSLKFVGANPEEYVGGGQTYAAEFARDIGLWVGPQGVLDIRGTPKTGWNRTGVDPTWKATDEYWIAPTAVGDQKPRRWTPGSAIPQADPRVPAAEVMNITRDIVIEGRGHIHIHSEKAQRLEYFTMRRMGVSSRKFNGQVLGRYALHLHFSVDGSRGTIIRGVAAIDSEGHVFVPHTSHGVTMIDNVSVNSYADALWWDDGDQTNDLLVDRLAVSGIFMPEEISGEASRMNAATLGLGSNMEVRNSAVSGAQDNKLSVGWNWPTPTRDRPLIWTFNQGNVSHNHTGPGIRFWTNQRDAHLVSNTITYRNGRGGIENGAYSNTVRYSNVLLVEDYIFHNSSSKALPADGRPARYENAHVYAREGPALRVGHRNLPSDMALELIDCVFQAGPGAPKVMVESGSNPWLAHFIRSGVTPDDIAFETLTGGNDGSRILIDHEDGRKWEILVQNGQKIVRTR